MTRPRLLVVGSVALDSLLGGRHVEELGGSALYFALAASLFGPVSLVAPVGRDAEVQVRQRLGVRGEGAVDATGLDVVDAPTYRWFADDRQGRNVDLGGRDSIYDAWSPRVGAGFDGWAFVGSMRADRQLEAASDLEGCALLAADAMRSYVEAEPAAARALLGRVSWFFGNEEELAALGGGDGEAFRRAWGLEALVLKRGPGGATIYSAAGEHHEPALFDPPAVDTTGAGDALAGALLGRWRELGGGADDLPEALRWGVAAATITIAGIGQRSLARAVRADVEDLATRRR